MVEPHTGILMDKSTLPASLVTQLMKGEAQRWQSLAQGHTEDCSCDRWFLSRTPSPPARAAPIRSSACGGAPIPPAAVCPSSDLSGCLLSLGRCAGRDRAFVAPHDRSGLTAAPAPSPARAREPWGQRRRGRTSARRPLGWLSALLQAARASSPR